MIARFARVHSELRSLTRSLKHNYEESLANNIKVNSKAFWKYVNSNLKTKLPVDTLRTKDDREAMSNQEKANTLNEYLYVTGPAKIGYVGSQNLTTFKLLAFITFYSNIVQTQKF